MAIPKRCSGCDRHDRDTVASTTPCSPRQRLVCLASIRHLLNEQGESLLLNNLPPGLLTCAYRSWDGWPSRTQFAPSRGALASSWPFDSRRSASRTHRTEDVVGAWCLLRELSALGVEDNRPRPPRGVAEAGSEQKRRSSYCTMFEKKIRPYQQ